MAVAVLVVSANRRSFRTIRSPKFSFTPSPRGTRSDGGRNVRLPWQDVRPIEELTATESVEDEATCALAPPPITSIDAGTEVRPQALWVLVSRTGTPSAD
jgi:hypothetical protein